MGVSKRRQAEIEERRERVSQLLKARFSYRDIAKSVKCSVGTVAGDVKAIFKLWADRQFENIREQALLDLATVNDALMAITNDVRSGDTGAINTMVRLLERRARILGYEAPTRMEHTGKDGGPIEKSQSVRLKPTDFEREELKVIERALRRKHDAES